MPTSLFRQPVFTRYLTSQTGSFFGYQMLVVAVGWQIYDLTNPLKRWQGFAEIP